MFRGIRSFVLAVLLALIAGAPTLAADDAPDPNAVLVGNLRGIRFVAKPEAVIKNGFDRTGVTVDGPYMLYRPGIYEQLQAFLNRPLREGDLARITQTIAQWYRSNDHPFVDVAFPEQDVSNGIVQAVVTEFRLGDVQVKGNRWFSDDAIRSGVRLREGDHIDASRLDDDLSTINQNDFRDVTVVAERSKTPGATDLVLQTDDRFPLRLTAGYANNGAPGTGRDRWSVGIDWGNAFFLGHEFTYQFVSNADFWLYPTSVLVKPGNANIAAHDASYTIPIGRTRLSFTGGFSDVQPDLGPFFGAKGSSWQAGVHYAIPFHFRKGPPQQITLGFDFRRSNNNLQFGGFDISKVTTDIDQFTFGYSTVLTDDYGQTSLSNRIELSPGNMSAGNTDNAFRPSFSHNGVPYSSSRYAYDQLSAVRLTPLPEDFGWMMRLTGQVASSNLQPSEKLAAGGIETVRGYDEYTTSGSMGVLMTQELRSPDIKPLHWLISGIDDQLQFDAFYDFAYLTDLKFAPRSPHATYLASAGGGFQYAIGRFVSVRVDYGWQLRTPPGAAKRSAQIDASIVLGN